MKPIIEVNNLSKKYKYGESQPYYTLRDILIDVAKSPFRFFHKSKQAANLKKDEFWALKDISFKVNQGEAVGIIGPNGAGKSTLLKILSQITPPTSGEAILRGRVGSLLEVGTGFNQELTGKENIYLNGAILGMSRREINKKFDEIVDFSGVEKFLDTPVKHYSSGMYMRLAFAVAAHLDSEILMIDEVLAVGDTEFQKKCLRKMDDVAKKEGRTVLFVSHNMGAVKQFCRNSILLRNGTIKMYSDTKSVLEKYFEIGNHKNANIYENKKLKNNDAYIKKVSIVNVDTGEQKVRMENRIDVEVDYEVKSSINALICLMVFDMDNRIYIFSSENDEKNSPYKKIRRYEPGIYKMKLTIPPNVFVPGSYRAVVQFDCPFLKTYDKTTDLFFNIEEGLDPLGVLWKGKIKVSANPKIIYEFKKIS